MGERKSRKRVTEPVAAADVAHAGDGDDAERALGRVTVVGLPIACLVAAVVVGTRSGIGSALLVLAAGALLGTIALLWASVRTLSGDAPLPSGLDALASRRRGTDVLAEQKRRVLRGLKDLESEHAIGKIDDADYRAFVMRYREEAKVVMRQMDLQASPARAEAEQIAREFLVRRGLAPKEDRAEPEPAAVAGGRLVCAACGTSNEPDAAFCKQCGAGMKTAAAGGDARK
jgi:hypothetical protein